MNKYNIYYNNKLFAYSLFEEIDFSMGIASGLLIPFENESYSQLIERIDNSNLTLLSDEDDIRMYKLSFYVFSILHHSGEKVIFINGTISLTDFEDVGSEIDFITDSREQFDRFFPSKSH